MSDLFEEAVSELQTFVDWVRFGASRFTEANLFYGHGTDNPWDDAVALTLAAVHTPFDRLGQIANAKLTRTERAHVAHLFQRRITERMPVPYLTGEAYFAGLKFKVNQHVLIPRSPLGEKIEEYFEPYLPTVPERILDLCTGSGCIGIACALAFESAEVVLSDISPAALDVASENIKLHQVSDRVSVSLSDGFTALVGEKFDLIVSNPPYVDAIDMANLAEEFAREPRLALASGEDGLDFTRMLLRQVAQFLNDQGHLIVEVGNSWVALEELFPEIKFTWLEFVRGGGGVFILSKDELVQHQALFDERDLNNKTS
jgi:ribosomal protein L3 glutamine methyltransferase